MRQFSSNLYHGSPLANLDHLKVGGTSLGKGLYLTPQLKTAENYAFSRAKKTSSEGPCIYQVRTQELSIWNVTNTNQAQKFLQALSQTVPHQIIQEVLDTQNPELILQQATSVVRKNVHNTLHQMGYEALFAFDEGEAPDIKPHEAFLVLDPTKACIHATNRL